MVFSIVVKLHEAFQRITTARTILFKTALLSCSETYLSVGVRHSYLGESSGCWEATIVLNRILASLRIFLLGSVTKRKVMSFIQHNKCCRVSPIHHKSNRSQSKNSTTTFLVRPSKPQIVRLLFLFIKRCLPVELWTTGLKMS